MTPKIKIILNILAILALCILTSNQVLTQDERHSTGIGVQFSTPPPYAFISYYYVGAYYPSSSFDLQPDILISAHLTDHLALEPSVGLLTYTGQTFWRLGISVVGYTHRSRLSPFIAVHSKAYLSNLNGQGFSDYLFGIGVGGEYFIGEEFSVAGECLLNHAVPQKDRSLFVRYNVTYTGVSLSARFYLN